MDEETDKENTLPIPTTTKLSEKKDESNSPLSTVLTSAVVTRVVDGDTIKVKVNGKEETVRLILVDTPETKHPKLGVQPFGPEASSFTKNTLTGEEIELEKDVSERDRYGRLLRYVWIDGKLFNETLIEKGLARVAVFQPDVKYIDQFRELQQKAQKQRIGIWSIENYAQEDGYHTEEKKSEPAETPKTQPKPKQEEKPTSGSCNIKGNISSSGEKIFHVLGGQFYDITEPEAMFCSKAAALAAGYRASKR
ncbi:thermonuclease family protein [Psychrobacillus sp. L3]|uniref:thermonuclease family protein n=1 Tax=Psychrobacillus sp. L3 TaxID=3236891 RepID=UPI0036F23B57